MSLFSQLVKETADQKNHALSDVLLNAKVLASRLGGRKFRHWIDAEINGYDPKGDLPEYRIVSSSLLGEFGGYFNSFARTPLSTGHLEKDMRDYFRTHPECNGVSFVEDLVQGNDLIGVYLDSSVVGYMRRHGTQIEDMILNRVFKTSSRHSYKQLLHSVRCRLLDFLLELREKYPELDKTDEAAAAVSAADVDAAVDQKVYHNCTFYDRTQMRDAYQAGQAGAMGPNAKAENMNFVQIMRDAIGAHSLGELAADLESLRAAMLSESKTAEQDDAVAAVAGAEEAAKKGDAKGVFDFLRRAGKWASDMAGKIGATVAGKAIEKSIGLS